MDFQRHILQGPKRFVLRAAEQRPRCAKRPREHVPQRAVSLAVPDAVALAQSFRAYRDVAHFRLALSCLILVAIIHQLRLIDGLKTEMPLVATFAPIRPNPKRLQHDAREKAARVRPPHKRIATLWG